MKAEKKISRPLKACLSLILASAGTIPAHCHPAGVSKQGQHRSPNIVFILADDLGYGDLSGYNQKSKTRTPHIDQLASQGVRFTDAHSPSAVCTPTRYGILTGRYSWRSTLKSGVLNGYSKPLIEKSRTTVASFLKKNGYTTAVVGKWHLGLSSSNDTTSQEQLDLSRPLTDGPPQHGFDYSYILPASLDMPPYCYLENNRLTAPLTEQTQGNNPDNGTTGAFWRKGSMSAGFDFDQVTPTCTQKAISFIQEQAASAKPFFLYLTFPSPHTPWLPLDEYRGTSKAGSYGDFVRMVDAQVGKILKTLDQLGLAENTIVFFTSDNGPFWKPPFIEEFDHHAAFIYRGMKADAYEGGHRIPFIVRWPGKVHPHSECSEPITLTSLLATCADVLNKKLAGNEGEDSFSILPLLTETSRAYIRPEALIQHSARGLFVVRQGDWKLILGLGSGGFSKPETEPVRENGPVGQLYNLKEDPGETTNLYLRFPEKVATLSSILKKYQETGRSRF